LVGGVVVILFGKFQDKWNDPTVGRFIQLFPSAMAATITFGVAPLLFVQLVYPRQVYAAAIVSGWFWLLIVVVAIVAYYLLYAASFSQSTSGRRADLYLSLTLIAFVYISYVYSSVFSLAERPNVYKLLYAQSQSGWVLNPDVGSVIFRWLHMVLGAVTVGSYFVGLVGRENQQAYDVARRFFLWAMIAAMIVGLAYLFTFGDILVPFMRTPAVWYLMAAIVLSLGSLHFFFRRRFAISGVFLFTSLLGMVAIRHTVRLLHLRDIYDPSSYAVKPQWSVFTLFLFCLLIATAVIWYMLRLFFSKREQPS
ncbi:MAG TPA: hypothetical protein VN285_07265, partial [Candidatus Deferrimicrobium sp.]|nr:hypothetical protein [Candidatus Deferrimicrobium sp.]